MYTLPKWDNFSYLLLFFKTFSLWNRMAQRFKPVIYIMIIIYHEYEMDNL